MTEPAESQPPKTAAEVMGQIERLARTPTDSSARLGADRMMGAMYERLVQNFERRRGDEKAAADKAADDERQSREFDREHASFWFRRFFTTLGIANAAGFTALASGLAQSDSPEKIAGAIAPAMDAFIWGALNAGSIPLFLWFYLASADWIPDDWVKRRLAVWLLSRGLIITATVFSVWYLGEGLFSAVGAAHGIAAGHAAASARVHH